MKNQPTSVFYTDFKSWKQGALVVASAMIIMIIVRLFSSSSEEDFWQSTWITAATFILFFTIVNSIFCLSAKDQSTYFWQSLLTYAGVSIILIGFATLLTGKGIEETDSFKWLFIVITICYLVLISIVRLISQIIHIVQKQDKNLRNEK